ncbi:MAG: hypothetical protein HC838_13215 [Spirulinaceae cyanobacterium RM2_2_10]|nr:hypothetical protein [Spirulinaceae cyanobacterium RM2_2_10]
MLSREVDAYLILLAPDGRELAQDDDGTGSTDARIVLTLPTSGTYTVIANSYQGGETGRYAVRVQSLNRSAVPTAPSNALVRQEGVLAPGAGTATLPDGSLYQEYTFQGRAGQSVLVTLESPDFDTYLIVLDSQGRKLAENDDAQGNTTNSQLSLRLPNNDTYRVLVNAYDRGGRGRYRLTIR